ncbi:MAG: hypothetical protein ACK4TA_11415 [Saprospiraceae bacterium]
MDNQQLIKSVITIKGQDYIAFLGDEFTDRIIQASIKREPFENIIEKPVGGASFDWETSIKFVYEITQLIANVVTIYQGYELLKKYKPSKEEVISQLKEDKTLENLEEINEDEAIETIEETITQLKNL